MGVLLLAALLAADPPAAAPPGTGDAAPAGVTVTAYGEAKATPTLMELEVRCNGASELAADAVVKFRDAARRLLTAYEKLKVKELTVEPLGLQVGNEAVEGNRYGNAPVAAPKIELARAHRLTVRGIDKLSEEQVSQLAARLLDTAKDANLKVGPPRNSLAYIYGAGVEAQSLVTYVVEDAEAARGAAAKQAFDRAKKRAKMLAEMAGAVLGRAEQVAEVPAEGKGPEQVSPYYPIMKPAQPPSTGPQLRSDRFAPVAVTAGLTVRFALAPAGGETKGGAKVAAR